MGETGAVNKKGHGKNYGLRVFAYSMYAGFNGVESIVIALLSVYMTNSLFLAAGVAGALIAGAKVFDGFTDIVAGMIVDRTKSRWGKGRPFTWFAVFMWIAVVVLFSGRAEWPNAVKCAYVFIVYVLTDSVFRTLVEAADPVHFRRGFNGKEQMDSIAFWGTIGGLIAICAGIAIPTLLAKFMAAPNGWTIIALIFAVPGMIFSILKFFFLPETQTEEVELEKKTVQKMSVGESLKYLFRNKYIFIYALALILTLILQSMGTLQTYYFIYIIGDLTKQSVANTFQLVSIVVMPFYAVFFRKFGSKKKTAVILFIIGGLFSIIPIFMPMNYVMIGLANTVRMICYGSINVMTALYAIDCMKYTEKKDGVQIEALVASIVSVAKKLGAAIALLLSGVILQMAGYDGSLQIQPDSALSAIKFFNLVLPAIFMFLCALVMHFYNVEKEIAEPEAVETEEITK